MHPVVEQLRSCPIAEKLRVIEELWDDISQSEEALPLQDWHRAEADRRSAELDASPSLALTREELWQRIRNRNA